jgi:hypothetical protein
MSSPISPLRAPRLAIALILLGSIAPWAAHASAQGSGCAAPCGTVCTTTVPAGTIVGATWDQFGSPYCVTGDIQVSLLTIQPGVCVLIDGPYKIDVLTTINASGTAALPITFTAKDPAVRWKGLRFQNTQPGSILRHCRFSYSDSAALRLVDSSPTIENCLFENNSNVGAGGAISASIASGDLLLSNCKLAGNTSTGSGAAVSATMSAGTFRAHGCIIANNSANPPSDTSVNGGGLIVSGSSEFQNCSILGNSANVLEAVTGGGSAAQGGGLYTSGGNCVVANCSFQSNLAKGRSAAAMAPTFARGGGIYLATGTIQLTNSVLGCNRAEGDDSSVGAGLYMASGTANAVNCTIVKGNVRGIHNVAGLVTVRNSILYFNNASGTQVSGAATIEYSDVQGSYAGTGNIDFNPAFAGTGCELCDLTIILGSPCIDAGDPAAAFDDVCTPPSLGQVRNDIGAHGGPGACDWVNQHALQGFLGYCIANPNSSGHPARMSWCGSSSIGANDLVLIATGLPLNKNGLFFYGSTEGQAPLGNGWRCMAGSIARLPPMVNSGASGTVQRALDYGALPQSIPIVSGSVRRFQFWYRDSGGTTNTTDGLEAYFGP